MGSCVASHCTNFDWGQIIFSLCSKQNLYNERLGKQNFVIDESATKYDIMLIEVHVLGFAAYNKILGYSHMESYSHI